MITTGIVTDINYDKITKNTSYSVDIAIFKNAGISNQINSSIFDCPCSINPGTYVPYNIGDKVYIGFVNNKWNLPIILGKIYESLPDESVEDGVTYQYINSLTVSGGTKLSNNTIIGNTSWQDIQNTFIKLNEFQEKIESILSEIDLNTLKQIVSWWVNNGSTGGNEGPNGGNDEPGVIDDLDDIVQDRNILYVNKYRKISQIESTLEFDKNSEE